MSRSRIEKLDDKIRHAINQRHVLEDKYVRREIMQALDEYTRAEHDYPVLTWEQRVEYKPEEMMR